MYEEVLRARGAAHVAVIPIVDQTSLHKYHLMHASKNSRAYSTMKDAVSRALRVYEGNRLATAVMRFRLSANEPEMVSLVLARFARAEVAWGDERTAGTVKHFLLNDTPAFPDQMDDIKRRLADYKLPGRRLMYRFPATSS
jgi:hypothetical protein